MTKQMTIVVTGSLRVNGMCLQKVCLAFIAYIGANFSLILKKKKRIIMDQIFYVLLSENRSSISKTSLGP